MKTKRMLAVDVFRGMTIFFMILVNTPGSWSYVYAPLRHAKWHGCTPTDLVFPFFLFISGVSLGLSLSKRKPIASNLLKKIWKRVLIIFLIGLTLNWFPFYHQSIADLRIMGVLQRIALAYGIAGTMIVIFKQRAVYLTAIAVLVGYQAILYFGSSDPYSLEHNVARALDLLIIGENHVYHGFGIPFDPEGLLHSFPAAINVVLGYMVAKFFIGKDLSRISFQLMFIGLLWVIIGWLWSYSFPINKPLWTSTYVLYTCGLGTLVLAAAIYLIDILKWEKWTYVFRVFGLNPLASYVLSILLVKAMFAIPVGNGNLYGYLYNSAFAPVFGQLNGSLFFAITYVFFIWFFAWLLYRQGKVIKI